MYSQTLRMTLWYIFVFLLQENWPLVPHVCSIIDYVHACIFLWYLDNVNFQF